MQTQFDPSQTTGVGPMGPKSERNMKRAKCYSAFWGPSLVEWKFRTGQFHLRPFTQYFLNETMFDGLVEWKKFYWLTAGVSIMTRVADRRKQQRFLQYGPDRRKVAKR